MGHGAAGVHRTLVSPTWEPPREPARAGYRPRRGAIHLEWRRSSCSAALWGGLRDRLSRAPGEHVRDAAGEGDEQDAELDAGLR